MAVAAFVTMFHPDDTLVWGPAVIVLGLLLFGLWRHRLVAPPQGPANVEESAVVESGDLSQLIAEAKREV
jgi:hypothetical protein